MKRKLLGCGLIAGPLFVTASLAQAFTRSGFDLARHPISLLSLGSVGWIQIANFVLSGVLYVIGAVGLRTALRGGRGGTWGPLFIGLTGIGLIIAGVFTADAGRRLPAWCSGRRSSHELARRAARGRIWAELCRSNCCVHCLCPPLRSPGPTSIPSVCGW